MDKILVKNFFCFFVNISVTLDISTEILISNKNYSRKCVVIFVI